MSTARECPDEVLGDDCVAAESNATDEVAIERVVLASDDYHAETIAGSDLVLNRFELHNRARAIRTLLTVFADYSLEVEEKRWGRRARVRSLKLRFLDPRPQLSRSVSSLSMRVACIGASISALLAGLAYFSIVSNVTLPLAVISGCVSAIAAVLFIRRTVERISFQTAHGRAAVMTLTANLGCLRAYRAVIPELVAAILESRRGFRTRTQRLLRDEMLEHYRLNQAGIISQGSFATAQQNILDEFHSSTRAEANFGQKERL